MILLIVSLVPLVYGCTLTTTLEPTSETTNTTEDPILKDTISPLLKIDSSAKSVVINQGEDYNLLDGITGMDNLEGNITNRIEMNIGNFDKNVPGVYEILYFLTDRAGNSATSLSKFVTVIDTSIYQAPPVYFGVIPNEQPKPSAPGVFSGAWYHKVVSSKDVWYGIEGTITLPTAKITRYENNSYNPELDVDPNAKNLDNPSIYMGGNATTESDIGLSFSKVCTDANCTNLSRGSIAFRPFWRYITDVETDAGGYDVHNGNYAVSCSGTSNYKNCIANWHFKYTEYYYLPGDKVRMLVYSPKPNYLQMQIEVIEKSTLPESIRMREEYGWNDPEDFKSPIFRSPGHGTGALAEYKRVNAIDQVNNEAKPTIETTTEVRTATWHEVYLYRKIEGTMYRVPMTSNRVAVVNAPHADRYTTTYDGVNTELGGEKIYIHPGYSNTITTQVDLAVLFLNKKENNLI
jgi:hypothetical protein